MAPVLQVGALTLRAEEALQKLVDYQLLPQVISEMIIDNYGSAIAADGRTLAVVATQHNVSPTDFSPRGTIFVYQHTQGQWILQAQLTPAPQLRIATKDFVVSGAGSAVAIDQDRLVTIAGASNEKAFLWLVVVL